MKIKILQFKTFIPKSFMLHQHNRNSGVKLPIANCYSHAKFEKFLPAICIGNRMGPSKIKV